MKVDQSIKRIRAFAAKHNLPKARLAKMAGMHDTRLRFIDDDGWNPTVKTLRGLESAIDIFEKTNTA